MRLLKFSALPVLVIIALVAGQILVGPVRAQEDEDATDDRSDNKILITGVPEGWAVTVAQPGANWPLGDGNVPDDQGTVTAYAPLNTTSNVYLWDGTKNNLIATVNPSSTYPDTVLGLPVQFAQGGPTQGFPSQGLASPAQPTTGQSDFGQQGLGQSQSEAADQSTQWTGQYTVQSGDTLGAIARQYGTTISDLATNNNIADPNLIITGQLLVVP